MWVLCEWLRAGNGLLKGLICLLTIHSQQTEALTSLLTNLLFKQNSQPLTLSLERWLIFNINWKGKPALRCIMSSARDIPLTRVQGVRLCPVFSSMMEAVWAGKDINTHWLLHKCLVILFTIFSFAGRSEMGTNRQWPPQPNIPIYKYININVNT